MDPAWYMDSGATNHITSDLNNLSFKSAYRGYHNEEVTTLSHASNQGSGMPLSAVQDILSTILTLNSTNGNLSPPITAGRFSTPITAASTPYFSLDSTNEPNVVPDMSIRPAGPISDLSPASIQPPRQSMQPALLQPPQHSIQPVSSSLHPMITRGKNGISKPKVFSSCYLADIEPKSAKAALQDPKWLKAIAIRSGFPSSAVVVPGCERPRHSIACAALPVEVQKRCGVNGFLHDAQLRLFLDFMCCLGDAASRQRASQQCLRPKACRLR
ncbi:hypothetical protein LWI29_036242 [Acer saccharum]|uniref:Uncharacterized protein n=1 Tax=Acer saccharum TaxID=4024 RepID=A0AA39TFS9_ACESA|nr:hypothetical protein LWI29_036242 [Acer saccharum]